MQKNKLFINIDPNSEQIYLEWAHPPSLGDPNLPMTNEAPTTTFEFNINISRALSSTSFLSDCKTWIQFHERVTQELKYLQTVHKVQNTVKVTSLEKIVVEFHSSENESDQFPSFGAEMQVSNYPHSTSPQVFPSSLWQQRHPQLLNQWKVAWSTQNHPLSLTGVALLWLQLFAVRNQ